MDYDEEGRLTSIKRDNGTTQTLAYEYAYGFDGGPRWRKDYDNNIWNWMPCGVACCAGELVVLQNAIDGPSWTAESVILPADPAESHDGSAFITSVTRLMTREIVAGSSTGSVVVDQFGGLRAESGSGSSYFGGWNLEENDDADRAWLFGRIPNLQGNPKRPPFPRIPCRHTEYCDKMCDLFRSDRDSTFYVHNCYGCCDDRFPNDKRVRELCMTACLTKSIVVPPPCICSWETKLRIPIPTGGAF